MLDNFLHFLRTYNILRFIELIVHVCLMNSQCEVSNVKYIILRREHKVYVKVYAVGLYLFSFSFFILLDLVINQSCNKPIYMLLQLSVLKH